MVPVAAGAVRIAVQSARSVRGPVNVRLQGPFLVIGVGIGEDRPLVIGTGHDGLRSWLGSPRLIAVE
jgi:hypothetical protein